MYSSICWQKGIHLGCVQPLALHEIRCLQHVHVTLINWAKNISRAAILYTCKISQLVSSDWPTQLLWPLLLKKPTWQKLSRIALLRFYFVTIHLIFHYHLPQQVPNVAQLRLIQLQRQQWKIKCIVLKLVPVSGRPHDCACAAVYHSETVQHVLRAMQISQGGILAFVCCPAYIHDNTANSSPCSQWKHQCL